MRKLFLVLIIVGTFAVAGFSQSLTARDHFQEATRFARKGEFENALENYRKVLSATEIEPTGDEFLAKTRFNLGVCLYQLNRAAEAVKELNEALKVSRGTYQKAFYALGMAEFDLQNYREAKEAFLKALKLNPKDGEAWFDLAMLFLHENDFNAAQKAFQKSIENKSLGVADAHNNIGVIFALNHDFSNAEREFKIALRESDGKSIEAAGNLRFCKFYRQNIAEKPVLAQIKLKTLNKYLVLNFTKKNLNLQKIPDAISGSHP